MQKKVFTFVYIFLCLYILSSTQRTGSLQVLWSLKALFWCISSLVKGLIHFKKKSSTQGQKNYRWGNLPSGNIDGQQKVITHPLLALEFFIPQLRFHLMSCSVLHLSKTQEVRQTLQNGDKDRNRKWRNWQSPNPAKVTLMVQSTQWWVCQHWLHHRLWMIQKPWHQTAHGWYKQGT